jgi:hypothetical protein
MIWRRHERGDLIAYGALAGAAAATLVVRRIVTAALEAPSVAAGQTAGGASVGGTVSRILDDPDVYLSYTWQMFLPRLPFMNDLHPGGVVGVRRVHQGRVGGLRLACDPLHTGSTWWLSPSALRWPRCSSWRSCAIYRPHAAEGGSWRRW